MHGAWRWIQRQCPCPCCANRVNWRQVHTRARAWRVMPHKMLASAATSDNTSMHTVHCIHKYRDECILHMTWAVRTIRKPKGHATSWNPKAPSISVCVCVCAHRHWQKHSSSYRSMLLQLKLRRPKRNPVWHSQQQQQQQQWKKI